MDNPGSVDWVVPTLDPPWNSSGPIEEVYQVLLEIQGAPGEDDVCLQTLVGLERLGYPQAMISFLQTVNGARVVVADPKFASAGKWAEIAQATTRPYDHPRDILPLVLQRRAPRYVHDSRDDEHGETDAKLCRQHGLVSQYVMPLATQKLAIGTLQVDLGTREEHPAGPELRMLDSVAAFASMAIERWRIDEQMTTLEDEILMRSDLVAFASTSAGTIHGFHHELKRYAVDLRAIMQRESVRGNKDALRFLRSTDDAVIHWLDRLGECIMSSGEFRPTVHSVESIVAKTIERLWDQMRQRKCTLSVDDE
jgi:hypothetical protein